QLVEDAPARDFQQPTFERIYRWIVSEPGHFSGYGDERLLDHLVGLDLIQTGPARDTVDQLAISPMKLLPTRLVAQILQALQQARARRNLFICRHDCSL